MKMKASSFLRSVTAGMIPVRSKASSAVAPLPIRSSSFDQHATVELDHDYGNDHDQQQPSDLYTWCLRALNASIAEQRATLDSLSKDVVYRDSDRERVDEYLDFNVRMLDTYNELSEKIEETQNYVVSLRIVMRLLDNSGGDHKQTLHPTILARVKDALDSCLAIERRCNEMDQKSYSSAGLKKVFSFQMKPRHRHDHQVSRLSEILSGSKEAPSMAAGILQKALSFKSRRGLSQKMQELDSRSELQKTASLVRGLREQIMIKGRKKSELRIENVKELKIKCEELENGIKPLKGKVKELYKNLISVRMALLGILSHFQV